MSNAPPPGSDPIYKRLYAFARMVEDLLRSLFTDAELGADYDTLEKLPTEYVGEALQQRRGDTAWRLRARAAGGGWLHVLVMLEFQSGADSAMALRVLEYTALMYGELLRSGAAPGALPPVLPVVLYNGDAPWRPATEMRELIAPPPPALAPYQPSQRHVVLDQRRARAEDFKLHGLTWEVAQLEQSRAAEGLPRAARRLAALLGGAGQGELRRTFAHWLCAGPWAGRWRPSPAAARRLGLGGHGSEFGRSREGVAEAVHPTRPRRRHQDGPRAGHQPGP